MRRNRASRKKQSQEYRTAIAIEGGIRGSFLSGKRRK